MVGGGKDGDAGCEHENRSDDRVKESGGGECYADEIVGKCEGEQAGEFPSGGAR